MIDLQKKIGEIATENPASMRVFESLEIDYCCNGRQTFEQASESVGLTPSELFALIAGSEAHAGEEPVRDWTRESLRELIFHIVGKHHTYTRNVLPRLAELCDKVLAAHRENHPELISLRDIFAALAEALKPHLMKEEQILFPYVAMMEDAIARGRSMPVPPFATLESPIRLMMHEHEAAAEIFRQICAVTFDFHIPLDGCSSYRALMTGLLQFERDLHLHIHLENNILFPRAMALESSGASINYEFANSCGDC